MKFFAPIVVSTAAVLMLQLAAAEELECYWCMGFRYDRNETKYYNTKGCTLESFNKEAAFTNVTSVGDEYVVACITSSVWVKDMNHNEPVTARGAVTFKRDRGLNTDAGALSADLFGEDFIKSVTKAHPDRPVYFGTEFCFENLCNTHTYHRDNGAAAVAMPGVALLLLPAVALKYFA